MRANLRPTISNNQVPARAIFPMSAPATARTTCGRGPPMRTLRRVTAPQSAEVAAWPSRGADSSGHGEMHTRTSIGSVISPLGAWTSITPQMDCLC